MRVKAGNTQTEEVRTLEFPSGSTIDSEIDGHVRVGNGGSIPVVPEKYGAVGDGVTDDTAALQAWAASGLNLGGTEGKTYLQRAAFTISASGVTLDGSGCTFKRSAQFTSTTTTAIVAGVTNAITLASAATFKVGDYIVVEQSGNFDQASKKILTIVGNVVTISGTFSISLSGTMNVRTAFNQVILLGNNNRVTNCTFDGNYTNWTWARWWHTCAILNGDNLTAWENHVIDHNRIINQPGDAMSPTGVVGCTVAFNHCTNINGRGISWAGSGTPGNNAGGRCVGNRFKNCEIDATVTQSNGSGSNDGNGAINISSGVLDLIIDGNEIDGSISGVGSVNSTGNSDISIINNAIRNTSSYAIEGNVNQNSPVTNVLIAGNRIYATAFSVTTGIYIITSQAGSAPWPSRWMVKDNLLVESAIFVQLADQVSIDGNMLYSAGSTGTLIQFSESTKSPQGVSNAKITNNIIVGGDTAISVGPYASAVRVDGNVCTGQMTHGITATTGSTTSYTDLVFADNTCVAPAAATNWLGIRGNGAMEISNNTVDFSLASGGNGIYVTGTSTGVIVRRNKVNSGSNSNTLVVAAGATGTVVRDNVLNKVLSDSGTATQRSGNAMSAGALTGKAVLVAGTVTVSTVEVLTGDTILLTHVLVGGTIGIPSVGTIVNATSFVINSSNAADTGTVYWEIRH